MPLLSLNSDCLGVISEWFDARSSHAMCIVFDGFFLHMPYKSISQREFLEYVFKKDDITLIRHLRLDDYNIYRLSIIIGALKIFDHYYRPFDYKLIEDLIYEHDSLYMFYTLNNKNMMNFNEKLAIKHKSIRIVHYATIEGMIDPLSVELDVDIGEISHYPFFEKLITLVKITNIHEKLESYNPIYTFLINITTAGFAMREQLDKICIKEDERYLRDIRLLYV